ncbi:YceD family protein [Aurantiacibacter suaedae]|uniref:YceD family protein n=1 Tax=Aurantiacibacter suaedae TaxID=2545755 RepID=UPI0010F7EC6B|nr:DUF177 domain-containing protein [Aurantiacibacter suaedae]
MSEGEIASPEFSRIVDRRSVGEAPVRIGASEAECAALAKRFGLVSVERLEADIVLDIAGDDVLASGTLRADIVQSCAVSGDDLPATIEDAFSLRFVPEEDWADYEAEEVELGSEDLDALPYDGTSFDLGEAVAQSLVLAIDPFATGPDADTVRSEQGLDNAAKGGALAEALAQLKKD